MKPFRTWKRSGKILLAAAAVLTLLLATRTCKGSRMEVSVQPPQRADLVESIPA